MNGGRIKRNLTETARFVISSVESFGMTVSPSSRIGQMYQLLVESDGSSPAFIPPNHPKFEVALEAIRDMLILQFIFEQVSPAIAPVDMKLRVKTLLHDSALPQDSTDRTRRRDVQSELYVGALCAKAGLSPKFAEPDVVCQF